jgi:hypothetical protein
LPNTFFVFFTPSGTANSREREAARAGRTKVFGRHKHHPGLHPNVLVVSHPAQHPISASSIKPMADFGMTVDDFVAAKASDFNKAQ